MGNVAILAKEAGFSVQGFDQNIYPPMSDLLAESKIEIHDAFDPKNFDPPPDQVIVGNANLPRGNEALEFVLNEGLSYLSGAEWLGNEILRGRHVIAVSGTHGKTTTTAMIAWILEQAGKAPGYLIAGSPIGLDRAVNLGRGSPFVVEADEYDTSYFDRRSKFLHYRPQTLVINNIEFDHADIFTDLDEILFQFQHLIRAVPGKGRIVAPSGDANINDVIQRGCWTPIEKFQIEDLNGQSSMANDSPEDEAVAWTAKVTRPDATAFDVLHHGELIGSVEWSQLGEHNVANGMAAIIASRTAGMDPSEAISHLASFKGVKRRMEVIAKNDNSIFYSDFAHHPTSIRMTLGGLRKHIGQERILAVIEPRTHTMSLGTFREQLKQCCNVADEVIWFQGPNITWDMQELTEGSYSPAHVYDDLDKVLDHILSPAKTKTHVVIMSNGSFGNIFAKLVSRISETVAN